MAEDVMQRVIRVIADTQKIPAESIKPDSTFQELKIDSLDGINIIFAVENEFNVNVPDDTVKMIRSVRDVAEGVEKLLASA
jgi:acyl carrier protein